MSRHDMVPTSVRSVLVAVLAILALLVSALPSTAATPGRTLDPASFGARGDGRTDDTLAIQRALDALAPGDTLRFAAGRTYPHSDILTIRTPGAHLTGPGTLLATAEARSAVLVDADDVLLDGGLVLRMGRTTERWHTFEQMKLRINGRSGVVVRNVRIEGAAAAGVYVGTGASNFLLEDVTVVGTRADGIHITGGAHDGVVRRPVTRRTGDDGVAVVSYRGDGAPVRRVLVTSPRVTDSLGGRGVAVVGGEDITYQDVSVNRSAGAGIYVAAEGAPYFTYAPKRISVRGAVIVGANTNATVGHGAVLVYAGAPGFDPAGVSMSDVRVSGTRTSAPWQVGIVHDSGANVSDVRFDRFRLQGQPSPLETTVPRRAWKRSAWTVNGIAVS
jgi:hypothetical protein